MAWKVYLYDDDGNEYEGTVEYDSEDEANEEADSNLDGSTYIDGNLITSAIVDEV